MAVSHATGSWTINWTHKFYAFLFQRSEFPFEYVSLSNQHLFPPFFALVQRYGGTRRCRGYAQFTRSLRFNLHKNTVLVVSKTMNFRSWLIFGTNDRTFCRREASFRSRLFTDFSASWRSSVIWGSISELCCIEYSRTRFSGIRTYSFVVQSRSAKEWIWWIDGSYSVVLNSVSYPIKFLILLF